MTLGCATSKTVPAVRLTSLLPPYATRADRVLSKSTCAAYQNQKCIRIQFVADSDLLDLFILYKTYHTLVVYELVIRLRDLSTTVALPH